MKYSVGIDLGTSNSCVSICDLDGGYPATINIVQVVGPNVIGEKPLLPSALYLSIENEFAPGSLALPWNPDDAAVIGVFARERGALAPDRLVSSAKSWLCNPQVDRHAPILPWKSELAEGKLSPFEASRRYLEHLRQALEQALVARAETASLADCMIVLTVPASFDEVARELTHQAAREAGLGNVTLLEEPQAAFYAWIAGSEARQAAEHWSSEVRAGDLVLVCDVGGGTADFTLIAVAAAEAGLSQALELHRIAVGEHILLGGDNMDLALAYALKDQISAEGHDIDHWQFLSLIQAARAAKERLLSDAAIAEIPIAVPTRGASLFAKTLSTTLSRAKAMALIIEGYFPRTAVTQLPKARKSAGLQEFGLNYATEPAFSRHLARFLTRARENVHSDPALSQLLGEWAQSGDAPILRPSAVLFNGGVFHAQILRERVLEVLGSWLEPGASLKEIKGVGLDTAVALGAAYYGAAQLTGRGIKIRAGTSRSYYIGLESPMPAVPDYTPPVKAICIVPQGSEEGTEWDLTGAEFGLVTGEPVEFRFFSSAVRAGDRIGTKIESADKTLEESSSLTVALPPVAGETQQVVPVTLRPVVTEVGTLELWMCHRHSDRKWKLEFNLRPQA